MAIDNPEEKIREHYLSDKKTVAEKIVRGLVDGGLVVSGMVPDPLVRSSATVVKAIINRFESRSSKQTLESLVIQVLELYANLQGEVDSFAERAVSEERVMQLITEGFERAFWGANDRKVTRFAAVISSTVTNADTDQQYEDAAYFIKALDELSEADLKVLRYYFMFQEDLVHEGHEMNSNIFFQGNRMKNILENFGKLKMQTDEIYSRCSRLSGYGLMLPLDRRPDQMLVDQRAFRITIIGKRLVDILIANRTEG